MCARVFPIFGTGWSFFLDRLLAAQNRRCIIKLLHLNLALLLTLAGNGCLHYFTTKGKQLETRSSRLTEAGGLACASQRGCVPHSEEEGL